MLGMSRCDKDAKKQPKKLLNMSEQVYAWSDQREEEYSPRRPPNKPGNEMVIPGDLQGTHGSPIGDGNAHSGKMILPCQDTRSGGHRGDQEMR